jgi:Caspase domain.
MAFAQTQRALLIGINTYQPAGTSAQHPAGCIYGRCELGAFENLDGAVNDAQAMADLLTGPKFAFPANNVVLLTNPVAPRPRNGIVMLPAAQTDRDGILAAMQKYLVDLPKAGDTVVFYNASHGSLRVNSKGTKLTVLVGGKYVHADSTMVPSDAYKGGYDIRDREMSRIFNAALDKGIHLTAIFDSCHSGGMSRGIGAGYKDRTLAYDPRDIAEAPETAADGSLKPAPTDRKENPALVFSAAQQDQTAKEMPAADEAAEPHGAFTAALIEALNALPANAPATLIYQRVKAVLEGNSVPNQEPDLDATAERRQQPLFGGNTVAFSTIRAAALHTDESGNILLDVGRVSGVGVGSEFAAIAPNKKGQVIKLRVTELAGIARSKSTLVGPAGAKVAPGDIFELTTWIPAERPPLHVYLWPADFNELQLLAASDAIAAAGITLVADPADEQWTHILFWDGRNWQLQQAGAQTLTALGSQLTALALRQNLPAHAKLWANLPPPKELVSKLALGDSTSAVKVIPTLASADYALTGTMTADGPAYAWFHKNELLAGSPKANLHDHSPGCSATSQYPLRSDWLDMTGIADLRNASESLNKYLVQLSKVHGWLELASDSADLAGGNYYTLALTSASGAPLSADERVHQNDQLKIALTSSERVIERRWVYVLDIDCHGKGTLLYPLGYSENQFPNSSDTGRRFLLPGARTLRIGPPYGMDTLILLSTADPLPDPYVLNFDGAATRQSRGIESPLSRLLANTSSGTRGIAAEVPTNWGISISTLRSMPKEEPEQTAR